MSYNWLRPQVSCRKKAYVIDEEASKQELLEQIKNGRHTEEQKTHYRLLLSYKEKKIIVKNLYNIRYKINKYGYICQVAETNKKVSPFSVADA